VRADRNVNARKESASRVVVQDVVRPNADVTAVSVGRTVVVKRTSAMSVAWKDAAQNNHDRTWAVSLQS